MRIGENNRNLTELEKKAGQKAARTLRRDLRAVLSQSITSRTGIMLNLAGASAKMRFDMLDSVYLKASSVTFKQHYGFEGIKKNRVKMKLKSYGHFDALFDRTKAPQRLISEVAELRGSEVLFNVSNQIKLLNDGK